MNTIDKIRAEIKKLQDIFVETAQGMETEDEATVYSMCAVEFGDELLSFLDTLGAETSYDTLQYNPSPSVDIGDVARVQFASHAKVFDKKRKAVFDWEQFKEVAGIFYGFGQRNNTFSDEPVTDCHDLEEEMEKFIETFGWGKTKHLAEKELISATARHFAEWGAKHTPLPEDTVLFQKGVEEGKRLMMEGAVEGEVVKDISNKLAVTAKNINLDGFRFGDKVRIIIVKEEKQ